jgi:hypothetical protein
LQEERERWHRDYLAAVRAIAKNEDLSLRVHLQMVADEAKANLEIANAQLQNHHDGHGTN